MDPANPVRQVNDHRLTQVQRWVISVAFGVVAAAVGRLIHQKPVASPWLLLGLVPGLVGLALVLTS